VKLAEPSANEPGRLARLRGHSDWRWLAAIVLAGAALRLWGIQGTLPLQPHQDEGKLAHAALKMLETRDPYPETGLYPPTMIYVFAAAYGLHGVTGLVTGRYRGVDDLRDEALYHPATFLGVGRLVILLLALLTLPVVYALGRQLAGSTVGLLSAAGLALSPAHVAYSQRALVDIPAVFFCTLSLYYLVVALQRNSLPALTRALICAGIGLAIKYTLWPLLAMALVVWVVVWVRRGRERKWGWLRPGVALGCAFLLACPLFLASPSRFIREVGEKLRPQLQVYTHAGEDRGKVGERANRLSCWWGPPRPRGSSRWTWPRASAGRCMRWG